MLHDVDPFDVVQVPEGFYGQITTTGRAPMPEGMFIAPVIPTTSLGYAEAETFIDRAATAGPRKPC